MYFIWPFSLWKYKHQKGCSLPHYCNWIDNSLSRINKANCFQFKDTFRFPLVVYFECILFHTELFLMLDVSDISHQWFILFCFVLQLAYCIVQFLEKDPTLTEPVSTAVNFLFPGFIPEFVVSFWWQSLVFFLGVGLVVQIKVLQCNCRDLRF